MSDRHVRTVHDGPITRVVLNRADKLNGITWDMLDGLTQAAKAIAADTSVRAVVIEGEGASFCAGLDFADILSDKWRVGRTFLSHPLRGTNGFQQPLWVWRQLAVPVVAVTQGHVFGGGLQLALAADFRFTTPECSWAVLEAKWGLVPDMSGTVALRELVPADLAKRLVMTGETFTGQQAFDWGIASGVSETPQAQASDLIAAIIERSPDSVAASKRLLERTRSGSVRHAFAVERRLQRAMFASANTKIARSAGASGTKPKFGDRTFGGR